MDIMELGAIGELVGGVAVIGSLIYLGLQVRQSNEQSLRQNAIAETDSNRTLARDLNTILLAMTRDLDLCRLWRLGLNDFGALTKDEQMRLNTWLSAMVVHLAAIWLEARSGLLDDSFAMINIEILCRVVKCPGGAQWWAEAKSSFPPDFVGYVDQIAGDETSGAALTEAMSWYTADATAQGEA